MTTRQGRILCFKYCLYGFSLLFMMVGFGLLTLGVWLKCDIRFRGFLSEEYRRVVTESFWNASTLYFSTYLIILIGAVMIVVAFFGCCGAIHENQCILITYFVLLTLLFMATLGVGIFLISRKDQIDNEVSDALTYMVQHYYIGPGIIQETMDNIQTTFRCCGNGGCVDYRELLIDIPRSCDLRCDACSYRVNEALRVGYMVVSIVFLVVLVVMLFALGMSLLLCCWVRTLAKEMEYRYYAASGPMDNINPTPLPVLNEKYKRPPGPPNVSVRSIENKMTSQPAYSHNRPSPQPVRSRNVQNTIPDYIQNGYRNPRQDYSNPPQGYSNQQQGYSNPPQGYSNPRPNGYDDAQVENTNSLPEQYFGQPPPGYSTKERRF